MHGVLAATCTHGRILPPHTTTNFNFYGLQLQAEQLYN